MNDKTAIEKAREALVSVSGIVDVLSLFDVGGATEGSIAYKVKEAIAALDAEKPGEDAREVARIVHEECFVDISQTTSTPSRSLIWDVDTAAHVVKSFAASYHAAQCAKCKALPEVKKSIAESSQGEVDYAKVCEVFTKTMLDA